MEEKMSEHESKQGESFTIKKDTLWKIGTFVFAALFVISLLTGGFGGNGSDAGVNAAVIGNKYGVGSDNVKVEINNDDPVLGNENAKISIIEFSDFECPFCARANSGALADFKASGYFADGEVNLVYKHFPLSSIHPNAQRAAEASECANDQGKFWEYHDILFATQQLDATSLKQHAANLGLNTATFNGCLDGGEKTSSVSQDLAQGSAAGARGTPYFVVINHETGKTQAVSGAVPFANFEAAINIVQ